MTFNTIQGLLQLMIEYIEENKIDNTLPYAKDSYNKHCIGLCDVAYNMYSLKLINKEYYKILMGHINSNRPKNSYRVSWIKYKASVRIKWLRKEIKRLN